MATENKVTGIAVVIKTAELSTHRVVHVVMDRALAAKQVIILASALPVGTKLRYTFDGDVTKWIIL